MQNLSFNDIGFEAADFLDGYTIFQKKSSNIAFYGFNACTLFVQFHNGSCYNYELTHEAVSACIKAESIGKFISNQVVGKYPSQKLENKLITQLQRETVILKTRIVSNHNVLLGERHEEVFLVKEAEKCVVENMKSGTRFHVSPSEFMRKVAA